MPRYRVTISGKGYNAMADLVREHHLDVLHRTSQDKGQQQYSVDAIVDDSVIPRLETAGYTVERHEDVDVLGRQRQEEIGRGDRYSQA
jgi:hypothetical protein